MDSSEAIALKTLLMEQPVAALATLHQDEPAVSMVPFALLPDGTGLVIHVSRLAAHTSDMLAHPGVGLLVTGPPEAAPTPLALPRVSFQGQARPCAPESCDYQQARAAYLAKLPEAEELFALPDFSLFVIKPASGRYVAGFGRAMALTAEGLRAVLASQMEENGPSASGRIPGAR
jgi:putative heme iron utilization protein